MSCQLKNKTVNDTQVETTHHIIKAYTKLWFWSSQKEGQFTGCISGMTSVTEVPGRWKFQLWPQLALGPDFGHIWSRQSVFIYANSLLIEWPHTLKSCEMCGCCYMWKDNIMMFEIIVLTISCSVIQILLFKSYNLYHIITLTYYKGLNVIWFALYNCAYALICGFSPEPNKRNSLTSANDNTTMCIVSIIHPKASCTFCKI